MNTTREPYALGPGEGEAIWYRGTLMTVKAGAEQTGGRLTLIEHAFPPGFAAPLHVHHREEEPWYVLEGHVQFGCGELEYEAAPGAFMFLPRDVPHRFRILGDAGARMLLLSLPGGLEGMFAELGQPAPAAVLPPPPGPPDHERMRAVAARYGVEFPDNMAALR